MTMYDQHGQLGFGQRRYHVLPPPKRRRIFFSFHYADVMRVNNVRKAREFAINATVLGGDSGEFIDSSLWERKKLDGPDALKRLIREGMENSSAVCVLVGTQTWSRPWVRYEIARSLIDRKGLLAVHINSLSHHQYPFQPHEIGLNPLDYIGIYRDDYGRFRICEQLSGVWYPYDNYRESISLPKNMDYLTNAPFNQPLPLSGGARTYDWVHDQGAKNFSAWVNEAVFLAGRE